MLDALLKDADEKMDKAVQAVDRDLGSLRTGRASVHTLDGVKVSAYGTESPINQVASVSTSVQSSDGSGSGEVCAKSAASCTIAFTSSSIGRSAASSTP